MSFKRQSNNIQVLTNANRNLICKAKELDQAAIT